MKNRDWKLILESYEAEMSKKLKSLPGHKETSDRLRSYRGIISHELPESTPVEIYKEMVGTLLKEEDIDIDLVRKEILEPQLKKEANLLEKNRLKFRKLQKEALIWIKENLPEEELQKLWKEHKTWLPRRYAIYKNPNTSFQKIAADTLARHFVLMNYSNHK